MKKVRLLLAGLPLLFLASASPDHVAIGLVHFGTSRNASLRQFNDWRYQLFKKHHKPDQMLYAGEVRQSLLYEGTKTPGKLTASDNEWEIWVDLHFDRPKMAVIDVRGMKPGTPADWDTKIKDLWLQFRDICDCKFERTPRNSPPGLWPEIEKIQGPQFIVTDSWEYEGIKVELGLLPLADYEVKAGYAPARVALRVTNPLTQ